MRYLFGILLALVLPACAADEPDPELDPPRFALRPITVQASTLMRAGCETDVGEAVRFWYRRGATLVLDWVDPGASSQNGVPVVGVIALVPGKPSMIRGELAYGEVVVARTVLGDIYAAEATVADCSERVLAHEIGHALGLQHVETPGNLMHWDYERGGWALTPEQMDQAAD